MDTGMDWVRLGRAFKAARKAAGFTQPEAASRIGVSKGPIQTIDRGVSHSRVTGTMRAYARLVGWAEGSVERVLAGGDPIVQTEGERWESAREAPDVAQQAPVEAAAAGAILPRRIREELGDDGELLDTVVIALPGGGRALIVVKAGQGATAEEVEESLKAWREDAEPHLKGLSAD